MSADEEGRERAWLRGRLEGIRRGMGNLYIIIEIAFLILSL